MLRVAVLIDVLFTVVGLALLVGGGELLVRGASALALGLRISPAVIGLTVVAAGTSMPELVVSVGAAIQGAPDLAMGNVVGSNIYNILLILGLAALVRPLTTTRETLLREWPIMAGSAGLLVLFTADGHLGRLEGIGLLMCLVGFVAWTVWMALRAGQDPSPDPQADMDAAPRPGWLVPALLTVVGAGLLTAGASVLLSGATGLAEGLGVSERVIGLTVVALGTSLPELVTSVLAAFKGNADIAVGNVIGSNIFNILGILGVTAAIHPIAVNARIIALDNWVMLGVSIGLVAVIATGLRISRVEGGLLVLGAAAWTWFLL